MATHSLNLACTCPSSIAPPTDLRRIIIGGFPSFPLKSSSLPNSTLFVNPLSIRVPNPNPIPLRRHSTIMTISFSLPTSKREDLPTDKLPKWSARAIKSFAMGELEAKKLKYPDTGTEALLMGILVEGTSEVAKFLRANGINHDKVREETINLLGKSDMYFTSPEHPPLTEPAQKAIDWAIDQKLKSGENGEITVAYLLLGIWEQKVSAGHHILESLGFNDEKAKELAKYLDKDIVLTHK